MCGILATSRRIEDLLHITEFLKYRGPDITNHVNVNKIEFVHTLLSMTGPPTIQPFVSDDETKVALFNGEIYNYQDFGDFNSDGECLLPLYEKYGTDMVKHCDGEFAIIVVDFEKNILLFSTDVFSIKPLWFGKEGNEWGLSSYESCLLRLGFESPIQVEANSTYVLELNSLNLKEHKDVFTFNLKQNKNNFDDLFLAFEKSIKKRTQNIKHGIFIGLSSGYDSGAIACELARQNIDFTAYSIVGSENPDTIEKRIELTDDPRLIELTQEDFLNARNDLKKYCEKYKLSIDNGEQDIHDDFQKEHIEVCKILEELEPRYRELNDPAITEKVRVNRNEKARLEKRMARYKEVIEYRKHGQLLTDDNGGIGMSYICKKGRGEGQLIYLSGSGADEIFSDYGFNGIKHFRHSTIGGKFPNNLEDVFPWKNFFDNTQRAYLMKEEYVSGAYGIEGRYPYLDKEVVQEFLWLSPELKNGEYKAPLTKYMEKYNYPFDKELKVGFNCGFTGKDGEYEERVSKHRTIGDNNNDDSLIVNFDRVVSRTKTRKDRHVILKILQKRRRRTVKRRKKL
jgi:asparagine synthetase B (glutamine-hydrolysing)